MNLAAIEARLEAAERSPFGFIPSEDIQALIEEVGRLTVEHLEMRIERDNLRERLDYYRKALMKANGEIEAVKAAVQRHPDILECSEYPDEDGPIKCGWKIAYRDVVHAMKGVE